MPRIVLLSLFFCLAACATKGGLELPPPPAPAPLLGNPKSVPAKPPLGAVSKETVKDASKEVPVNVSTPASPAKESKQ